MPLRLQIHSALPCFSALRAQKSCIWPRSPFEKCSQMQVFEGSRSPNPVNMQSKWPLRSGRLLRPRRNTCIFMYVFASWGLCRRAFWPALGPSADLLAPTRGPWFWVSWASEPAFLLGFWASCHAFWPALGPSAALLGFLAALGFRPPGPHAVVPSGPQNLHFYEGL